jgi:hypothetical protein
MPNFVKFNVKDRDGRWYKFDHQQLGSSCTIASARTVKEYYHNTSIGEGALRGLAALFETHNENKGISQFAPQVQAAHDWETTGGNVDITLHVLKAQPLPINSARMVTANRNLLKSANKNHPVLIGWTWVLGGGHCTVCVGKTKTDENTVIILDPYYGLQYVDLTVLDGGRFVYCPAVNVKGIHHTDVNTFITTSG